MEEPARVEPGDRAAARADPGDLDHRHPHGEAEVDLGLRRAGRAPARDERGIERGAAHVAGDEIG
jgi:hypothetical protein